MKFVEILKRY